VVPALRDWSVLVRTQYSTRCPHTMPYGQRIEKQALAVIAIGVPTARRAAFTASETPSRNIGLHQPRNARSNGAQADVQVRNLQGAHVKDDVKVASCAHALSCNCAGCETLQNARRLDPSVLVCKPRSRFPCFPDIGRAVQTAHFLDLNAVEHRDRVLVLTANLGCCISALPPQRSLL
jgi:hypothetical protein